MLSKRSVILARLDDIERMIANGASLSDTARAIGVSPTALYDHARQVPAVADAIRRGRAADCDALESALHTKAMGFTGPDGRYYPPDVRALLALLGARRPKTWGKAAANTQVDVTITAADRALLDAVQARLTAGAAQTVDVQDDDVHVE